MKINPEKHAWDLAATRLPPYLKRELDRVMQKKLAADFDPKQRPIRLSQRQQLAINRTADEVARIRANRRGKIRLKQDIDDASRAEWWLRQEFSL